MSSSPHASTPSAASETTGSGRSFRRWQWRILLSAMGCYVFYYTGRQAFGFAIPGIQDEYGIAKVTLGFISATMLWAYAAGQFITGGLSDRFGGRRMMGIGAICSTAANWAVSLIGTPIGIGVTWGINGLFQSMGWSSGHRVISQWWHVRERGKAFSFYTLAAGLSSVFAYVGAALVIDVFGLSWHWVFRLPVLLLLVSGLIYLTLVREKPADVGFRDLDLGELPTTPTDLAPSDETASIWTNYRAVLSIRGIWLAGFSIGFQNAAKYALLVWVPTYILAGSEAGSLTALSAIALPIGMAIGTFSNGFVSDRLFGARRSPAIALFMFAAVPIAVALFLVPRGGLLALTLLFVAGFLVNGPQASFWALCPDLSGRRLAGTAVGVVDFFAYLCAGLEEPIVGHLLDSTGNNSIVFVVVAGSCAISGLIALTIHR